MKKQVLHLYHETRKYLGYETEVAPVPKNELINQLKKEGYTEKCARETVNLLIERGDFVCVDETIAAIKEGTLVNVDGGIRPSKKIIREGDGPSGILKPHPNPDASVAPCVSRSSLGDRKAVVDETFYPDEIQARDIWVTWALDDKGRKRPRAPWKRDDCYPCKWKSDLDDDERPETDFEEAHRYAEINDLEAAGFVFPDSDPKKTLHTGIILPTDRPPRSRRLTLIDWDDVRDPETGEIHPTCAEYLRRSDCYAEVSQSGAGIHQFVIGGLRDRGKLVEEIDNEPFAGNDDPPAVEVYDGGRHVAMTGQHVEGTGDNVVEGQGLIDSLVTRFTEEVEDTEDLKRRADNEPDPEEVNVELDDIDAPDDLPKCYRRALEGRVNDNAGYTNAHDLNLHAAILGVCSGYSVEEMVKHFREYPPDGSMAEYDEGKTRTAVEGTWGKVRAGNLNPVGLSTLRENDLLDAGEECDDDCPIHGNGGIMSQDKGTRHSVVGDGVEDAVERGIFETKEEAKRYLRKRGKLPMTHEVRRRTLDTVKENMKRGKSVVVDAPTCAGKSYGVATNAWRGYKDVTDGEPVVHLHKTKEARREAYENSKEEGIAARELVGRRDKRRGCPIARGDLDDDIELDGVPPSVWIDQACEGKGLPFSVAHAEAVRRIEEKDADLLGERPCPDCPPVTQHEGVPRDDDGNPSVDVIHATHPFAYVSSYLQDCNVVIDEEPDYTTDMSRDRVRRSVTAFLQEVDAPVNTFERLLVARNNEHLEVGEDVIEEALEREPPKSWYFENSAAHALAPALARAVWYARDAGNGRKKARVWHQPPRFDEEDGGGVGVYVTLVLREQPSDSDEKDATVRVVPNFKHARSVIGLDAYPSTETWAVNTVPDIDRDSVLSPEERRNWRFYERGLRVVQIGDATRPVGKDGRYFDGDGEREILNTLVEQFGAELRTTGTGKEVEEEVVKLLKQAREEHDLDPEVVESLHYGEERSRNVPAFEDVSVGYVTHTIDPGDGHVLDVVAERGLDAHPVFTECENCGSDGCEKCDGDGVHRQHGRTFAGDDADKAVEILESVRANSVAQMVGRYARNAESDDVSVVFVRTDAVSDDLVDAKVKDDVWTFGKKQSAILDAFKQLESPTAREVRDELDEKFDNGVTKRHVGKTLKKLEMCGYAERDEGSGPWGADLWRTTDEDTGVTETGVVDLGQNDIGVQKITNSDVWDTYTWEFVNLAMNCRSTAPKQSTDASRPDNGGVDPGSNKTLDMFTAD